jgi:four helix bundle protein
VQSCKDLEVWRAARQVVQTVYALSREAGLARDFGLCGQVQRAAVSIMSNVAEGFERLHVPEKLQFYNVARGSSAEVRSLLYAIEDTYPSLAAMLYASAHYSLVCSSPPSNEGSPIGITGLKARLVLTTHSRSFRRPFADHSQTLGGGNTLEPRDRVEVSIETGDIGDTEFSGL